MKHQKINIMSRYKPAGWQGESYRHYLAAKGISSRSYFVKRGDAELLTVYHGTSEVAAKKIRSEGIKGEDRGDGSRYHVWLGDVDSAHAFAGNEDNLIGRKNISIADVRAGAGKKVVYAVTVPVADLREGLVGAKMAKFNPTPEKYMTSDQILKVGSEQEQEDEEKEYAVKESKNFPEKINPFEHSSGHFLVDDESIASIRRLPDRKVKLLIAKVKMEREK